MEEPEPDVGGSEPEVLSPRVAVPPMSSEAHGRAHGGPFVLTPITDSEGQLLFSVAPAAGDGASGDRPEGTVLSPDDLLALLRSQPWALSAADRPASTGRTMAV